MYSKINSALDKWKKLPRVRIELTAFRLWDWRAAYCATKAWWTETKMCIIALSKIVTTNTLNISGTREKFTMKVYPSTWRIEFTTVNMHKMILTIEMYKLKKYKLWFKTLNFYSSMLDNIIILALFKCYS